jgi:hypothetical protein
MKLLSAATILSAAIALTWIWPTVATECDSDAVLQQQVSEFNKLAARCEGAALQEDNYVRRLWHWKACRWDTNAPHLTAAQIQTMIKLGLHLYEPKL